MAEDEETLVLDTDIGHDPDDVGAIVLFVKQLFDKRVPAGQILLLSSAGGATIYRGKEIDTCILRARMITQVLKAMQIDRKDDEFSRYVNTIISEGVIAGSPGSKIQDPVWHFLQDPKKDTNSEFRPRYGRGQYKEQGQPLVKGALEWLEKVEDKCGVCDVRQWSLKEIVAKLNSKRVHWIGIGAATNLAELFGHYQRESRQSPFKSIICQGGGFGRIGKQVKTNARLDPEAFIVAVNAMQRKTNVLQDDCVCYLISSEITPDSRWISKPKQVEKADMSQENQSTKANHTIAEMIETSWPMVWECICSSNRDYREEERAKCWVFESQPHDFLTVSVGLIEAGKVDSFTKVDDFLHISRGVHMTFDIGEDHSNVSEGVFEIYGEKVADFVARCLNKLAFTAEFVNGDKIVLTREGDKFAVLDLIDALNLSWEDLGFEIKIKHEWVANHVHKVDMDVMDAYVEPPALGTVMSKVKGGGGQLKADFLPKAIVIGAKRYKLPDVAIFDSYTKARWNGLKILEGQEAKPHGWNMQWNALVEHYKPGEQPGKLHVALTRMSDLKNLEQIMVNMGMRSKASSVAARNEP